MWKWFFVCFTTFFLTAENPLEKRYIHRYPEIIAYFEETDYILSMCSITWLLITSSYEKKKCLLFHKLKAVTSQKSFENAFHYFIVLLLLFVHFRKYLIFEILYFQYYSKIGYSLWNGRKYFRLLFSELLQKSHFVSLPIKVPVQN